MHQVRSPSHQGHIDFERKARLYEPNPQSTHYSLKVFVDMVEDTESVLVNSKIVI